MLPFIDQTNPYFPLQRNKDTTVVDTPSFDQITRAQLIDYLVRLSKRDVSRAISLKGLVIESCLEYVGARWRATQGEERVDELAKELTEVEFEVGRAIFPSVMKLRSCI